MIERKERPNECCRVAENMTVVEQTDGKFQGFPSHNTIERCVCGKRHYVIEVNPIAVGVEGVAL